MVRNAFTFLHCQLGCADIHAPVELHRVDVDNFPVELVGQGYPER